MSSPLSPSSPHTHTHTHTHIHIISPTQRDTDPTLTDRAVPDSAHPISALRGTGLADMTRALEQRLLMATQRRVWHVAMPADGPELRSVHLEYIIIHVNV